MSINDALFFFFLKQLYLPNNFNLKLFKNEQKKQKNNKKNNKKNKNKPCDLNKHLPHSKFCLYTFSFSYIIILLKMLYH